MLDIKLLYKQIATTILLYLRVDLQLHFFWGMFLTLFAVYWQPLIYLGLIATVSKEALDLWSKGHWSWDDIVFGILGCTVGAYFVGILS
tara:strand:+ start:4117 stop:4383 length:267 start_codon:yes stop_codon:yes gene_type:complete